MDLVLQYMVWRRLCPRVLSKKFSSSTTMWCFEHSPIDLHSRSSCTKLFASLQRHSYLLSSVFSFVCMYVGNMCNATLPEAISVTL
jgi:hypothetical protein